MPVAIHGEPEAVAVQEGRVEAIETDLRIDQEDNADVPETPQMSDLPEFAKRQLGLQEGDPSDTTSVHQLLQAQASEHAEDDAPAQATLAEAVQGLSTLDQAQMDHPLDHGKQ